VQLDFIVGINGVNFIRAIIQIRVVLLLNGGTSNKGHHSEYGESKQLGSMEQHFNVLKENKIKCAAFYEPDLNHSMSAIAFLVDERVFNKKDYPDFSFPKPGDDFIYTFGGKYNLATINNKMSNYKSLYDKEIKHQEQKYIKEVGKDIAFLKDFLKQFRLA
jgi:hypothetical protein